MNIFIKRNGMFNSADTGVTIGGNIGSSIDESFLKINSSMHGKCINYVLGLYNGGGYSGLEKNNIKVFAMRLSTRPFANSFLELQVSGYFYVENSILYNNTKKIIGGLTYSISKNLGLVLNAEHNNENKEKNDIYELNLEVSF